jgi:cytochrome c-type biogenesis protein CcmH/NrfF
MLQFLGEFGRFLWQRKLLWMVPLILVLLMLATILIASSSPLSPFIYALF